MPIKIKSTSGGSVTIDVPGTAVDSTMIIPANNASLVSNTDPMMTGNVFISGANSYINMNGNVVSPYGMRNRIINGGMQVWQRGTSFSSFTTGSYNYAPDRFACLFAAPTAATFSQSTSAPAGFVYSTKLQRNSSNTGTGGITFTQIVESVNCYDLSNQPVTLSYYARAGANYSGGNLTVGIGSGTTADQGINSLGGWAGWTSQTTTQAITTTWTRYSHTVTLGSGIQELSAQIQWTPSGTAGADDSVYITGVQLERGTIATPFEYRQYTNELQLCQRYYETGHSCMRSGNRASGTHQGVPVYFSVTKRAAPTCAITNGYTTDGWGTYVAVSHANPAVNGFWPDMTASTAIGAFGVIDFDWSAAIEL